MIGKEIRGNAGYITIDRPERRNALDLETAGSMIRAVREFREHPAVRCMVIKARGTVFCAGADVKELAGPGGKGINLYADIVESILASPKPVIASVQGPAVGGGVGIVASCHLAAAVDSATFAAPEIKSDLFPLMVYCLASGSAGRKLVMEMALCDKVLGAREALSAGLLNAVVPLEKLDEKVEAWVGMISGWNPEVISLGLGVISKVDTQRFTGMIHTCQEAVDALVERLIKVRP